MSPCGKKTQVWDSRCEEEKKNAHLQTQKEDVYNHIKHLSLPYTIIDVGWWYQIAIPRLPSGRIDASAAALPITTLINTGTQASALTDLRDIGRYVAAIVADPRTLNRYVLAYNEALTPNQVYERLERASGEKIPREYVSEAELRERLARSEEGLKKNPMDPAAGLGKVATEYQISWGVRGDNTPEYAEYLGYLTSKQLYPDLDFTSFDSFLEQVLEGGVKGVYQNNEGMKAVLEKMKAAN